MYLLGLDIGSSGIKASILEAKTGRTLGQANAPQAEAKIQTPQPGWAEQDPDKWWEHVIDAVTIAITQASDHAHICADDIAAIGIAYQMHGLVLVDANHRPLRPSIIWCDSRAVQIGQQAFLDLGEQQCLMHLLNSPGNFTASKLKWVQTHEPKIYKKIHKVLLPGDYIALGFVRKHSRVTL